MCVWRSVNKANALARRRLQCLAVKAIGSFGRDSRDEVVSAMESSSACRNQRSRATSPFIRHMKRCATGRFEMRCASGALSTSEPSSLSWITAETKGEAPCECCPRSAFLSMSAEVNHWSHCQIRYNLICVLIQNLGNCSCHAPKALTRRTVSSTMPREVGTTHQTTRPPQHPGARSIPRLWRPRSFKRAQVDCLAAGRMLDSEDVQTSALLQDSRGSTSERHA